MLRSPHTQPFLGDAPVCPGPAARSLLVFLGTSTPYPVPRCWNPNTEARTQINGQRPLKRSFLGAARRSSFAVRTRAPRRREPGAQRSADAALRASTLPLTGPGLWGCGGEPGQRRPIRNPELGVGGGSQGYSCLGWVGLPSQYCLPVGFCCSFASISSISPSLIFVFLLSNSFFLTLPGQHSLSPRLKMQLENLSLERKLFQ